MTHRRGVIVLVMALAVGTSACSEESGDRSKATPTTPSTATGAAPMSGTPETGPVTEAEVAEVEQVLRRLDTELDRLDSDMAVTEGEGE